MLHVIIVQYRPSVAISLPVLSAAEGESAHDSLAAPMPMHFQAAANPWLGRALTPSVAQRANQLEELRHSEQQTAVHCSFVIEKPDGERLESCGSFSSPSEAPGGILTRGLPRAPMLLVVAVVVDVCSLKSLAARIRAGPRLDLDQSHSPEDASSSRRLLMAQVPPWFMSQDEASGGSSLALLARGIGQFACAPQRILAAFVLPDLQPPTGSSLRQQKMSKTGAD